MAEISTIPNLGPAMQSAFDSAGIRDAEALRDMGPDAAYLALLNSGHPPHFIGYYALVMGLQGRPWNDCTGTEKDVLRQRFDALKAEAGRATPIGIEAELDKLGVIAKS